VRFSYPLILDVSNRLVVIIGGGAVAARKAGGLLAAGAVRIRVVAPKFCDAMPATVERILEPYASHHLGGAGLVFAATDTPEVNAAVVRDAHQLGLLVNRADGAEEGSGDFSMPAVLRDDELIVAVSTGQSPTLAAAIRDEIQSSLDSRWVKMLNAMKTLRPRALAETNSEIGRAMLRAMATVEALEILEKQGIEALWQWLTKRHIKDA